MSASESDLSEASKTPAPPDSELETALRREVITAQKNEVDFSYKYIRTAAETKLGLTPGFYKSHGDWNQRSKAIIGEQMEIDPKEPSSPSKPKSKPAAPTKQAAKRKSSEKEPEPKKRQKTATQVDDEDVSEDATSPLSDSVSDFEEEAPKKKSRKAPSKPRATKSKPAKAKKAKAPVFDDEEEVEESQEKNGASEADSSEVAAEDTKPNENAAGASDSELSVLIDEEPAPKKKRKSKGASEPKTKSTTSKPSTKAKADTEDPDQAEIKRLQGWLVKCGIRKLWGKELKPYETSKSKIKHLRDMLSDAGMTGRYSIEKANQIKEARELAADIEAVQEGAERWGAEDEEGGRGEKDADGDARPAPRRLVRGAKNYDFLSSDGEETD
ncbi:hypothetical protein H2200_004394 [Cladophialophora chaetospira]|uniref:Transcriptional regulator n=1 Tax=Cladophialophora chaetospira TaxID=386627 RepID=A0AA38XD18_9EURO|nr:hypothetical protein H2200_004394 [Cladophialophora chaetospira]